MKWLRLDYICDICGKKRSIAGRKVNHDRCSRQRQKNLATRGKENA